MVVPILVWLLPYTTRPRSSNMNRFLGTILLLGSLGLPAVAQEAQQYFVNPVICGDVPDPTVIRIGNEYFAAGTSSEWAPHYPLFTSTDLVNWKQIGHVFRKQPEWTSNSFWAPELFYHNGKLYCYYTARQKSSGHSYIGVAVADSPYDEFVDYGPVVEHGIESIDAFVYNDNGQLYISWKAYGLENRPIEILGCKLSSDGLHLEGEPFTMLVDEERVGMEGQYHFKHGDYYYIIYASHGCCGFSSDYNVCIARAREFGGPYEKYEGNPILHGGEGEYQSCGHGTLVTTPDGRMFYMCHAYLKGDNFFVGRQPILQEMEMTDDHWMRFKTGALAVTRQPMPFEGVQQLPPQGFEDNFNRRRLNVAWTWNYPYADVETVLRHGKLYLSGTPKGDTYSGAALCVRPQSAHYECETKVAAQGDGLKGLTLYGDDKNLVVWGVENGRFSLKVVKDGASTTLYDAACPDESPCLRFTVADNQQLRFYHSSDGKEWKPVSDKPFDGKSLIRWDRVQRPGLLHLGSKDAPAEFDYFEMTNL